MVINVHSLHRNKDEWIEPEKFIPERFDPESKYFLTPNGQKRHPMSFAPFLGGKRICLGKTFAENIGKCVMPIILTAFDFEFVDPINYEKKPTNQFYAEEPKTMVKATLIE